MDSLFVPDCSRHALQRNLLREMRSQAERFTEDGQGSPLAEGRGELGRLPAPQFLLQPSQEMQGPETLASFMRLHDAAFLANAYRKILGREPDAAGFNHFLSLLRGAKKSKVRILYDLRHSAEGVRVGRKIPGLNLRAFLDEAFRLRWVGRPLQWLGALPRLHLLFERIERMEVSTASQFYEAQDYANRGLAAARRDVGLASLRSDRALRDIEVLKVEQEEVQQQVEAVIRTETARGRLAAAQGEMISALQAAASDSEPRLSCIEGKVPALENEIEHLQKSLSLLRSDVRSLRAETASSQSALSASTDARLAEIAGAITALRASQARLTRASRLLGQQRDDDAASIGKLVRRVSELEEHDTVPLSAQLYVALEKRFRGPESLIRERAREYLPFLREAGSGTLSRPILDLGCGRGELLKAIVDEGMVVHGVDHNSEMIADLRGMQLSVTEGNILEYVRAQPDSLWGAVTLIHVAEHLPFCALVELLGHIFRILQPGGLLLLETPDPQNIAVATHEFYLDPTHRRPLPGPLTQFLLEECGFGSVSLREMHFSEDDYCRFRESKTEMERRWTHPMDYAALAWKVPAEPGAR